MRPHSTAGTDSDIGVPLRFFPSPRSAPGPGRLILRTRRLWDPGHVRTLSSGYQLDGLATLGTGDHLTSARGRLANGHDRSNLLADTRAFARLAILESVS